MITLNIIVLTHDVLDINENSDRLASTFAIFTFKKERVSPVIIFYEDESIYSYNILFFFIVLIILQTFDCWKFIIK